MTDLKYMFSEMPPHEIEETVHSLVREAIYAKYGEAPDELITNRFKEEWHAVERFGCILDIAAMYEIVQWLKENRCPYFMSGNNGSSFILYMLGMSSGNPLPAHLYCPECKAVEFMPQYKDGFDIVSGLECGHDGTRRIADGHDISWKMLWGDNHNSSLAIELPDYLYEKFEELLQNHWIKKTDADITLEYPSLPEFKGFGFSNMYFTFLLDTEKITQSLYDRELTFEDRDRMLSMWRIFTNEDINDFPEPKNIADLISLFGLSCSIGVWDDVSKFMVNKMGYSLSDMIAFREDVYFYLLEHGFPEEDALYGMNRVRKGMGGLRVITDEMTKARDKWVIERCHNVKYLTCKAFAVEYIFSTLKSLL